MQGDILQNTRANIINLLENKNFQYTLISILNKFYQPPQKMQNKIQKIVDNIFEEDTIKVIVSGETKNLSSYFITSRNVIVYSPFIDIKKNVIVNEFLDECSFKNCNVGVLPLKNRIIERLNFPKVFLINPYIIENYPIPRLSLSVSILASYLRKYQKAEVYIVDTQFGINIDEIIKEIIEVKPDIIGISIPHAQTKQALDIIEKIYQQKNENKIGSTIVLGNFIAASLPKFFINKFPEVLICTGEGESTLYDLCEYIRGKKRLNEVSNLAFLENGKIVFTSRKSVNMDDLPLPALDTLNDLIIHKGALTHEWSRGCFWKCTFCPREHKPNFWKGFSPKIIIEQWRYFKKIIDKFNLQRRIYLADEETIGGDDNFQTDRLLEIAKRLKQENFNIEFDSYARVDQIYNRHQSPEWHVKRMEMWKELKQVGLSRLFLGVESGSETQLRRYGKGIKPEDSIMAIRILSALGINFRFGFITFDPLMNVNELIENIRFLERNDAFLKPQNFEKMSYKELFELMNNEDFIRQNSLNVPIYSKVSYMLASLEILINSNYVYLLRSAERKYNKKLLFDDVIDPNIGRYKTQYLDGNIGNVARYCQFWIDRNFSLMYTIKSLYKVALPEERKLLMNCMIKYRELSHYLLKTMLYVVYGEDTIVFNVKDCIPNSKKNISLLSKISYIKGSETDVPNKLEKCLCIFEDLMLSLVENIKENLRLKKLKDTQDNRLKSVIKNWEKNRGRWILLNPI